MPLSADFLDLMGKLVVGERPYGKFRGSDGEKIFNKAGRTVTRPCPSTGWESWATEQLQLWLETDEYAVEKLLTAMASRDEFLDRENRVKETERKEQIERWNGFVAPHGRQIVLTPSGANVKRIEPTYLSAEPTPLPAAQFVEDRYRIEEPLGEGGQALVHKATDLLLNRPVAIKSLEPFFGAVPTERDRERLTREGRALAALSHPNIPAVYDIQPSTSPPRIIFEFVDGINLLKVLNFRKPTLREVCRWMLQVCSALSHAHERGIIHRDLKPANIVLKSKVGTCHLVDFGLAVLAGDALRSSSRLFGTAAYMSPEHLRGEELDASADIYSLAVTMYQMLANKLPAPETYEPLSRIDPAIPHALDVLIQDCLRGRAIRLASAGEFARRLRDAVTVSLSMSEVLEHGNLLRRVIESLENASPSNLAPILDDIKTLRARLERLQTLVDNGQVSLSDLGVNAGMAIDSMIIPLDDAVKRFRQQYIAEALERFHGNRTQTARALDVNVRTIFRFLADDESKALDDDT